MKLATAIEILNLNIELAGKAKSPDCLAALRLGIKALERFYNLRKAGHYVGMPLLKGETLENTIRH